MGVLLLFHWCRNQGKAWNKKRVYRVYKAEKLNLRKSKARKKIKRVAIKPLPAKQINEGWSMDFLSDTLVSDEKKVRVLNVLDECSRMVLLSFAAKSISAKKLVQLLKELVKEKGKPAYLRCDNGPEFISKELAKFTQDNAIEIRFSQRQRPTVRKTYSKWIGGTIKRHTKKRVLKLKIFQNSTGSTTRFGHMVELV